MVKVVKLSNSIDSNERCETKDLIFELTEDGLSYNITDKATNQLLFECQIAATNPYCEEYETLYIMNIDPDFNLTGHKYYFSGEDISEEDYKLFAEIQFEIYIGE